MLIWSDLNVDIKHSHLVTRLPGANLNLIRLKYRYQMLSEKKEVKIHLKIRILKKATQKNILGKQGKDI